MWRYDKDTLASAPFEALIVCRLGWGMDWGGVVEFLLLGEDRSDGESCVCIGRESLFWFGFDELVVLVSWWVLSRLRFGGWLSGRLCLIPGFGTIYLQEQDTISIRDCIIGVWHYTGPGEGYSWEER
jgi:hypothetical protein